MRKFVGVSVLMLSVICSSVYASEIKVYFSPHGDCIRAIINEIDSSKQQILVQA